MMAADKVLVAPVETLEVIRCRDASELAASTTAAVGAREHKVPHAIPVDVRNLRSERVREEMVNIAEGRTRAARQKESAFGALRADTIGGVDGCIAIEAVSLLVTAKRTAD